MKKRLVLAVGVLVLVACALTLWRSHLNAGRIDPAIRATSAIGDDSFREDLAFSCGLRLLAKLVQQRVCSSLVAHSFTTLSRSVRASSCCPISL
jgi:hypothetical protein